ncbi:hypothetical protein C8J57DRAFT_1022552, partial [Mycena rebaudengoi]
LDFPNEITSEIFVLSMEPNSQLSISHAPLLVGPVCKAWRLIALATTALWASVSFPKSVEDLLKCVERAGNRLLSHRLSAFGEERSHTFVLALAAFSARWREVELRLPDSAFHLLQLTSSMDFSNLTRLVLVKHPGPRPRFAGTPETTVLTISNAPLLREACIEFHLRMRVHLPWQQLTSLEMHCPASEARGILVAATELLHFIHHDRTPRLPSPSVDAVLIPRLQSLDLVHSPVLLLSLTLPALIHLSLPLALELNYPHTMEKFVSRSGCKLRSLRVRIQEERVNLLHTV